MENQFFLNAGVSHPMQFEPSPPNSSMPTWQSLSSAMEIQSNVLNCPSEQTQDFFYSSTWDKSMDHHHQPLQFDSALSSMVSSPAESNENFVMRELIGKLGAVGNSDHEISPHSHRNSCYSTPLSSPPKPNNIAPMMMNHLVKENFPKPMALNSSVAEFSADPGFAERAAKFSCFGSRSFNERRSTTSQLVVNNNAELPQRSTTVIENGRLHRVSSSPSLKTFGSQLQNHEKMEVANSQEESTISEQTPNGELGVKASDTNPRKRKASSKGKAKEPSNYFNPTKGVEGSGEETNAKRSKQNEGEGNENDPMKVEEESKGGASNSGEEKQNKGNTTKPPEPPKDYIHVRARRGQATDSHSLAERVRREKISERMKLLQDLVPGCNKVTGKALMLDEIINYVQSLQRQVEFLSMKLASVNTRVDFSIESLISKDMFQSNSSLANTTFPLDSSALAFYGHQPQQNSAIHNNNIPNRIVDPLDSSLCQNLGLHLPPLNGSNEGASQFPLTFCEDDLNTIVQMGFGQIANRKTPVQTQNFNGSNQESHMKIEL